jgi:hypothetical protein
LIFGKDYVDAIKMNNQQRLELDNSLDERLEEEAASAFRYFPESSERAFTDKVDSSFV